MRNIKAIVADLLGLASELELYEANLKSQVFAFFGGGEASPPPPKSQGAGGPERLRSKTAAPPEPKRKLTQSEKSQIVLLHQQGQRPAELASLYRVKAQQISGLIAGRSRDMAKVRAARKSA